MRQTLRNILDFVVRYALWLLSVAAGFYLLLRTRTTVLLAVASWFDDGAAGPYRAGLVDKWGMIIMAIGLIVAVGVIEYAYNGARGAKELVSRFLKVTGVEVLILAGLDALLQAVVGLASRNTFTVILFFVELFVGVLLVSHASWWPATRSRLVHTGGESQPS